LRDLLIKNVHIVDCNKDFYGDVYIKAGRIFKFGGNLNAGCRVIDGEGLLLLPSFVDLHAHFRDPGFTYKEDILSGSRAAVKGGYTAVNLMANTNPVCSTMDTVRYVQKKAGSIGLVDVHQCVSVTRGFDGKDISHIDSLEASVRFISEDGKGVQEDRVMLKAMEKAREKGITIISHAENMDISPVDWRLAENLMTARDLVLAKHTGCHLHMAHVSTREAMEEIIRAKEEGFPVTCEVTPHHIALTDEVDYRVNPPLRKESDVRFLIEAVKEGWVDAISTDHAPHSFEDKQKGAPGISGLETSFAVSYTVLVKAGHITLNKLSELMSKRPAELMNVKKGRIEEGYDGDVVLVDISKKWTVDMKDFLSKGRNTPFEGREYFGKVVMTIKAGKLVYSEEEPYDHRQTI